MSEQPTLERIVTALTKIAEALDHSAEKIELVGKSILGVEKQLRILNKTWRSPGTEQEEGQE